MQAQASKEVITRVREYLLDINLSHRNEDEIYGFKQGVLAFDTWLRIEMGIDPQPE